jgi:alkylation response protein AidB-like acyl-CoA dehydrogenase
LRALLNNGELDLPHPGSGATAARHRRLAEFAREDVSLARLIEAHTDAIAILAEANREPVQYALYGVWASETGDQPLRLLKSQGGWKIAGCKSFCSGANIIDRALVTVTVPEQRLVDVDLRTNAQSISFGESEWIATDFAETNTAHAQFEGADICGENLIGPPGWYLSRSGFWDGACGPAACWAGGATGLVNYAFSHSANNGHSLAHLGAMKADVWAMSSCLDAAGREIDDAPPDHQAAMVRALALRHIIEQLCLDILARFGRAYGPRPLAFDVDASRRYQEVNLYLRQCHAERDLEKLGRQISNRLESANAHAM